MNRVMLFNIIKGSIELYLEDNLNNKTYCELINAIPYEDIDNNQEAYMEAELLCYLFTKIPYYQIVPFLEKFATYLVKISKVHDKTNGLSKVIKNGCIKELIPNIKRRIDTETMIHLYKLLYMYKNSVLQPEKVINDLTKNMYDPYILTSMDTAENINYNQITLPGIEIQTSSLRDSISHSNHSRKEIIRRNMEEYALENFDEKSLEDFIEQVLNIIDTSSLDDKEILKDTVIEHLSSLLSKTVVKWDNQKDFKELSFTLN